MIYFLLHLCLSNWVKQANNDLGWSVELFRALLLNDLDWKSQRAMKSPFTDTSFLRTSIVYSVNPAYLVLQYEWRSWSNFQEKATTLDGTRLFKLTQTPFSFIDSNDLPIIMILQATYTPTWPWKILFRLLSGFRRNMSFFPILKIIKQIKFPHKKWSTPQKIPTSNPCNHPQQITDIRILLGWDWKKLWERNA